MLRSLRNLARRGIRWLVLRNSTDKNWLIGDYLMSISKLQFSGLQHSRSLMFRGNILSPSSGSKLRQTRNQEGDGAKGSSACHLPHACFSPWSRRQCTQSLHRPVGITAGYGLDDRGIVLQFMAGVRNFSFLKTSKTALGPPTPSSRRMRGEFSPRVKRAGHEADHSSPYGAEV
jgi:hypothetical protein